VILCLCEIFANLDKTELNQCVRVFALTQSYSELKTAPDPHPELPAKLQERAFKLIAEAIAHQNDVVLDEVYPLIEEGVETGLLDDVWKSKLIEIDNSDVSVSSSSDS